MNNDYEKLKLHLLKKKGQVNETLTSNDENLRLKIKCRVKNFNQKLK